jgi:hypothetical protein
MGPGSNAMDCPENLWRAANLARGVRLHWQKQAQLKAANGGVGSVGGYNVDAFEE